MDDQRILQELLVLLEANSVTIRNEPLSGGGGGLCTVKGRQIFFVDTQAPSAVVAAVCAEAVVSEWREIAPTHGVGCGVALTALASFQRVAPGAMDELGMTDRVGLLWSGFDLLGEKRNA